ncbi:MAG TPA: pseudouridine synthase [Candidatus Polarisedimenticolia bacterium]|nr:pseudouridine synthase [Candidatus Polarisedimenticolia bacterium]
MRAADPPVVRPGDYARRLKPGERFEVAWDDHRRYHPRPAERPGRGYNVLHRDDALIVIDKGPEVLSVPTALRSEDSLLERLLEAEKERGIRNAQIFPVHRLDRDTSGLLLFARTGPALGGLKEQFADRSLERRYVAVVEGSLEKASGRMESRVVEDRKSLKVRSTGAPGRGGRRSPNTRSPSASRARPWSTCACAPAGRTRFASTSPRQATRSWVTGGMAGPAVTSPGPPSTRCVWPSSIRSRTSASPSRAPSRPTSGT